MKQTSEKKNRLPVFRDRLWELIQDQSQTEFAKQVGLSRQTLGFYLNGDRIPDAEGIMKICQACDVSADWLLGRPALRNTDGNMQMAHKATGLSEAALNLLNKWKESDDRRKHWPDYISRIIEDVESEKLFGNLSDIMAEAKVASIASDKNSFDNDMRAASLWYISRNFTNIIERLFITQLDSYLQKEFDKGSDGNGGNS